MIQNIDLNSALKIKEIVKQDYSTFLVEINGLEIQSEQEWLYAISESFHFPVFSKKEKKYINWYKGFNKSPTDLKINWNIYDDWMTDLDWLGKEAYMIIIYNYYQLLSKYPESKLYIINNFKNMILPWWEKDVVDCVVGGKTKPFNVYLVD